MGRMGSGQDLDLVSFRPLLPLLVLALALALALDPDLAQVQVQELELVLDSQHFARNSSLGYRRTLGIPVNPRACIRKPRIRQ
jgi:hypothetical protein